MLVDPKKESNDKGFNPNVDNIDIDVRATGGQKFGWWFMFLLSWLTIIGGIILTVKWVQWGNFFNRQQIQINEAASTIDVNLTRRRDTLIKLLEQTKSYMKFEKETLTDITKLRSMNNIDGDINKANEQIKVMDAISRDIKINFENYPNLKSSSTIMELMSSSQYLETEIASARRLYNLNVSTFNKDLFTFPKIVKADSMKLRSLPMFVASNEQKQDVDMSSLSNI